LVGAGVSVGDNVFVGKAVLLIVYVIGGIAVEAEVAIGLQAVSAVTNKIAVPVANLATARINHALLIFSCVSAQIAVVLFRRPNGLRLRRRSLSAARSEAYEKGAKGALLGRLAWIRIAARLAPSFLTNIEKVS
jgi:hypothetical protein